MAAGMKHSAHHLNLLEIFPVMANFPSDDLVNNMQTGCETFDESSMHEELHSLLFPKPMFPLFNAGVPDINYGGREEVLEVLPICSPSPQKNDKESNEKLYDQDDSIIQDFIINEEPDTPPTPMKQHPLSNFSVFESLMDQSEDSAATQREGLEDQLFPVVDGY